MFPDGRISDVTPPAFNARTRAYEYGGGAYLVYEGSVYFSNFADQRIYRQEPGADPQLLTTAEEFNYADAVIDARRRRL